MITLNVGQEELITLAFVDGETPPQPATVIAPPSWNSDTPSVITVVPATDGLSAYVAATGVAGTANVNISADGGPVAGDDPLTLAIAVTVVADEASTIVPTFGTPIQIPPGGPVAPPNQGPAPAAKRK